MVVNNLDTIGAQALPPAGDEGVTPTGSDEKSTDAPMSQSEIAEVATEEPSAEAAADVPPSPDEAPAQATESAELLAQTEASAAVAPAPESAAKTGMGEMFSEEYIYLQPKRGEIRQAQIIAIRDDGMMVDLGLKREGLIPAYDLQRVGQEAVGQLSVGDEIPVYIVRPEDRDGNIIVSWYRARQEQDWLDAQRLLETGEIWEGQVKGHNRGGLIVPFGKIRGFVPASHVTGISRRMDSDSLQARLSEMVGETLPLRVLEVNRQSRRLILSERIARREWRAKKREELLTELREGDIVHGVVSNICDFGVFVDIGGTDGLVHISELSWRRTDHPREVVKVGEEVDAYVLRVDRERRRIGLSLKMLEEDPWESAETKYQIGQLVTGVVTKLTDFGAFASLEDGIEGLIHISELAEVPPRHPSEAIARGAELPLLVVKVDGRRRRMGLSLKRVSEDDWYQWEEDRKAQAEELTAEVTVPEAEPTTEPTELEQPTPAAAAAEPPTETTEVEQGTPAPALAEVHEAQSETAPASEGVDAEEVALLDEQASVEEAAPETASPDGEAASDYPAPQEAGAVGEAEEPVSVEDTAGAASDPLLPTRASQPAQAASDISDSTEAGPVAELPNEHPAEAADLAADAPKEIISGE